MQTQAIMASRSLIFPEGLIRDFVRPNFSHGALQSRHSQRQSIIIRAVAAPSKKQSEALQYRKLGDSDLVISEVTLGTMTWGNQNTEKEGQEQLAYAFDQGVNILDTSEIYPVPVKKEHHGATDRIIAGWLKSMPRDKVILATKVAGYGPSLSYLRDSGQSVRVDRKNIKESVEMSLKRLQVNYIDLLQIHWPDRYVRMFGEYMYDVSKHRDSVPFEEQLRALQELIQEGKVRHIGVSNETSYGVMEFLHAAKTLGLPKIVSIQNVYNLLARCQFEVDLVETCSIHNGNVGLLAYSPLAGGTLSGKYIDQNTEVAKKGRLNLFPGYMGRYLASLNPLAIAEYAQIAKRHGMTPAQFALAFCRDRSFVASTIIGATTMDHLKENLSAFQLPRPMSKEINDEINDVFKKYRDPSMY